MKTIYFTITALLVLTLSACKSSNKPSAQTDAAASDTIRTKQTIAAKPYEFPDVPITLGTPEERVEFLGKHFWDQFDFADTAYAYHPEIIEQAWVDYINILANLPLKDAQTSIKNTMQIAGKEKRVYQILIGMAEKYLHDPNSPMRNEEFYIPVLEAIGKSALLDEAEKIRPASQLKMALKNRAGTKGTDFAYTLENGKQGTLYGIAAKYTLIYFHNPGCHACEEIMAHLANSLQIQHALSQKQIAILTLYPDEDLTEWKNHLPELPTNWINGYDKEQAIQGRSLYDLKAIPTLYLLDKDKKVLLKDTTVPIIEEYLRISK